MYIVVLFIAPFYHFWKIKKCKAYTSLFIFAHYAILYTAILFIAPPFIIFENLNVQMLYYHHTARVLVRYGVYTILVYRQIIIQWRAGDLSFSKIKRYKPCMFFPQSYIVYVLWCYICWRNKRISLAAEFLSFLKIKRYNSCTYTQNEQFGYGLLCYIVYTTKK